MCLQRAALITVKCTQTFFRIFEIQNFDQDNCRLIPYFRLFPTLLQSRLIPLCFCTLHCFVPFFIPVSYLICQSMLWVDSCAGLQVISSGNVTWRRKCFRPSKPLTDITAWGRRELITSPGFTNALSILSFSH